MHIAQDQVTSAKRRRREHTDELKRELVSRTLVPGASVSAIALEAGINANLLFAWRRIHLKAQALAGAAPASSSAVLLPVNVELPRPEAGAPAATARPTRAGTGTIEIDIGATRVRLRGTVDEASVRCVLRLLGAVA